MMAQNHIAQQQREVKTLHGVRTPGPGHDAQVRCHLIPTTAVTGHHLLLAGRRTSGQRIKSDRKPETAEAVRPEHHLLLFC